MINPPIPNDWSPSEALTIIAFLDHLREHIRLRYGQRIQAFEASDQFTEADSSQLELFDTNAPLPF